MNWSRPHGFGLDELNAVRNALSGFGSKPASMPSPEKKVSHADLQGETGADFLDQPRDARDAQWLRQETVRAECAAYATIA
jgi:hypothetical protein